MIRGNNIRDHDVVGVIKLVLITTISNKCPKPTAIKIVTKRTNATVVLMRFVNHY